MSRMSSQSWLHKDIHILPELVLKRASSMMATTLLYILRSDRLASRPMMLQVSSYTQHTSLGPSVLIHNSPAQAARALERKPRGRATCLQRSL